MVDELIQWPGARPPFHMGSCHLTTDGPLEELHAFAPRVGLRPRWFKDEPGRERYDLTVKRRARAIVEGATFVPAREQARARFETRRAAS